MHALARAGEHGLLWHAWPRSGRLLDRRGAPVYRRAIGTVLATMVANTAVKYTVGRARPRARGAAAAHVHDLGPLLPVGARLHVVRRGAGALRRRCRGRRSTPVACAMALSRPYLGVHYPSDIVAGALLGDAVARLGAPAS